MADVLPVTITTKALAEIRKVRDKKKIPDFYGLRIGLKGGAGCGGGSFVLGFDVKNEKDSEFRVDDIPVFIEKRQILYLAGKLIDYVEGEESGFAFYDEREGLSQPK